ncbi:hypothetical protein MGG_16712 [Pyricularia oryzae 70-15]|uniref:Secreted protein n=1 Tax=Pyricularia oryzae (strain 70-15 / ATCC MYA-4617 / FGSC 8958) TaxID=242507 RepID=G4N400_PYRO7|nr:uncharacterized protein MGG_16712 [Pyricularia oryzae 70-15]EHA51922.1 hypothetical protein MGG_16712 [Pyricularia oryzae 70-15]
MAPSSNLLLSFFLPSLLSFLFLGEPGKDSLGTPSNPWRNPAPCLLGLCRARCAWSAACSVASSVVGTRCEGVGVCKLGRPAVPLPLFPATARDGKELRGLTVLGTLLCPCPGLLEREKVRKNRLGKVLDLVPNYSHPNASKGKCASRPSDLVHAGFWSRKQAFLLVIIDVLQQAPGLGNWPGDHCNFKTSVSASKNWTLRQATSPVVPLSIGKEVSLYLTPRRHQRVRCSLEKSRPGDFDGDRVGAEKGAGWLAKLLAG